MTSDPLEGVASFIAVVEAQSFSAGARQMKRSKAALSLQVKKLEDRLGVRLLNRTTRRLSLTDEGRRYAEHCRRILDEIREAEDALDSTHTTARGRLRINAPMSFGIHHLGSAVADFMIRYPQVSVELVLNDQQVELVDSGFDMAIRIANLPDSSLVARRISSCRRIVVATPDYWDKFGRPEHPDDLKSHNVLLYDYLETPDTWSFNGPDGRLRVPLKGNFRSNNGDVMLAAVRSGLGVDKVPTFFCCEDIRSGRLEPVLQAFEEDPLIIYAVYPHRRHLPTRVRLFMDFLEQRFTEQPHWDQW